eukprot:3852987-Alexandrium_andersonii.AAC.1
MCIRDSRLIGRSGICTTSGTECIPPELQGPVLRSFLRPRSSSFERLNQLFSVQLMLVHLGSRRCR